MVDVTLRKGGRQLQEVQNHPNHKLSADFQFRSFGKREIYCFRWLS